MKFKFSWKDSRRVPKEVTFPDGSIEKVQYMRDGICLFMSNRSASYERLGEHEVEFTTLESDEQTKEAIEKYKSAQPHPEGEPK